MKKYIIASAAAAVLLGGSFALAQNTAPTAVSGNPPMVVQIGPGGRTLLRGTVSAVGTNALTVKSWGGSWVINIASSTKLMPGSSISQFAAGDFVGVNGIASQTADWTIDATLVRNWTERRQVIETRKEIQELKRAIAPRNWEGMASEVNGDANTFKLTVGDATYDIKLVAAAKIVDKGYVVMNFAAIQNGHTVRVYGPASGTTITASVVRDVSVGK